MKTSKEKDSHKKAQKTQNQNSFCAFCAFSWLKIPLGSRGSSCSRLKIPLSLSFFRGLCVPLRQKFFLSLFLSLISASAAPNILPILSPITPIESRLRAINHLSHNLSQSEISAIFTFLQSHPGPDENNRAGLLVVKNNLLTVLKTQETECPGLTELMIAIYHDQGQDPVMRDYAIQHLTTWCEQEAMVGRGSCRAAQVYPILLEAAHTSDTTAGTALLGLHRLERILTAKNAKITESIEISPVRHSLLSAGASAAEDGEGGNLQSPLPTLHSQLPVRRSFSEGGCTQITSLALHLATAPETQPIVRITAIQVCAERGIREALPAIQEFANDPKNIVLQTSAKAALKSLSANPELSESNHL